MSENNAYGAGATTHLVAREAARVAAQTRYQPGTTVGNPDFSLALSARDPRYPAVVKYPTNPGSPVLVAGARGNGITTGVNTVYVPSGFDQRATVVPGSVSNVPKNVRR